jgi:hypothetical protein
VVAMKRDFLVIITVMLAVFAVVSNFWVSPDKPTRIQAHNQLNADPNSKLVSEESPYMRTER